MLKCAAALGLGWGLVIWGGAAALVGADEAGVRIAVFGDSGAGSPEQKAVARQMKRFVGRLDHVLMLGDNVYFTGQKKRFDDAFHDIYRAFLEPGPDGEPPARFHAALGNHDVRRCALAPGPDGRLAIDRDAYAWREKGCDVEDQLADPAFGYPKGRRYSMVELRDDSGEVVAEVFVLDSNTLAGATERGFHDDAQLEWLRNELDGSRHRAEARGRQPWRILTLHHPIRTPLAWGYAFGQGGHGEDDGLVLTMHSTLLGSHVRKPDPELQADLEPLVDESAVDIVFAGHNHFYARLHPDDDGVRHVVAGGGGVGVYKPMKSSANVAAAGGFNHFVTAILSEDRFEYCVIDWFGRVRDTGYWTKETRTDSDRPLDAERRKEVCGE